MRLWRVENFPHEGTIFLAVSEQHRLVTCIKEGLRGNARLGAPLAYATGCSLLSLTLTKLLLLDISCENIFALSIVTAHPFSINKCARMSIFSCENLKKSLAAGGFAPRPPIAAPPSCQILSAPLESDCHMSEHFVFA